MEAGSGSTGRRSRRRLNTDDTVQLELPLVRAPRRRAPWYFTTMVVLGAIFMILSGTTLVATYGLASRYEGKIEREDILGDIAIPKPNAIGDTRQTLNFLVLGSDSRADRDSQEPEEAGARSDSIMIAHVNKDRTRAFLVSIPRDSYVHVPAGGTWRGGNNKINAAMALGGPKLTAKAVYELTKVPLNGAIIVNFQGIQAMVRAVGGVRVCIPYTVRSSFSSKVWSKGCHTMGPAEAEEFVRQRKGTPGGDFGRIKNQHHVIKALAAKATDAGMLTNPTKLDKLLTTAAESLTVDKSMNLRELAFALKGIGVDSMTFATVPYVGTIRTDQGSAVQLDARAAEELFAAMRDDRADEWLAAHPQPDVATF